MSLNSGQFGASCLPLHLARFLQKQGMPEVWSAGASQLVDTEVFTEGIAMGRKIERLYDGYASLEASLGIIGEADPDSLWSFFSTHCEDFANLDGVPRETFKRVYAALEKARKRIEFDEDPRAVCLYSRLPNRTCLVMLVSPTNEMGIGDGDSNKACVQWNLFAEEETMIFLEVFKERILWAKEVKPALH
ncbi:hypothetical protein AMJ39_01960 [candidate division TA06 bacterium DG_24]|jgi:hypothetical protein|uniref:Uncharacterized protein n=3 Tax=Bacteria division TA06 TaxID=1156500 RepID=A0A0S8JPV0_UNCT6|nr:MAG: hypothetical protein AMJ39_01960 [candidate division TA06 bacterium DG_24]KPK66285.1 MAG: hypothetical protein AMJ82_11925 [candidate division TA06 bacterium SM23_40]KPL10812.1 MAG: hypothetical protein AMJ71_01790 [candidate division TA06 bacterium SM1_40]